MRAYLAIKYMEDASNRPQVDAIAAALAQQGVESFCTARDLERWGEVHFECTELMTRTFEEIRNCDLLVLDISVKGVGLGIEAGYAHAIGKPIVVIARAGSDIPATLLGIVISWCYYETHQDLPEVIREALAPLRVHTASA